MSVRKLKLKGSYEDIGFALGNIAQNEYNIKLGKFSGDDYARGRINYYQRNWPEMKERMSGVARAYNLDKKDTIYDTSSLLYDVGGIGCTAIFFPPSTTSDGHPLIARNYDWYIVTPNELRGKSSLPEEFAFNQRSYMMELYPNQGKAILALSSFDLLNPFHDIMNDSGLYITVLADPNAPTWKHAIHSGGNNTGISAIQLAGMLADRCSTVEEAKQELLVQKNFSLGSGLHWLIADQEGKATVAEIDAGSGQFIFVDAPSDKPFVVANHPLHTYPTRDTFPPFERLQEYHTFNRTCTIEDAIDLHEGKFTRKQAHQLLDLVLCAFTDEIAAGIISGLPERTMWALTADLKEKNMYATFYLGDEEPEWGTNRLNIRRTDPCLIQFSDQS